MIRIYLRYDFNSRDFPYSVDCEALNDNSEESHPEKETSTHKENEKLVQTGH